MTPGEPPTLDLGASTDALVLLISGHVTETLFTWDDQYRPVPLLAASHVASEDGTQHTVRLRRGVPFHDGTTMTADDVVASLERWGRNSSIGATFMDKVVSLEQPDPHTLVFTMSTPFGAFRTVLARQLQGAVIHPASVLEAADETLLTSLVGTGPYRLAEWRPGQHLRLERFDDYDGPDGPASGYAGPKARYLDAIDFVPMPDEAARVASTLAGDVHYLDAIGPDHLPTLTAGRGIEVAPLAFDAWLNLVLNLRSSTLADLDVRRAVQAALDHESVLLAAVGDGGFELSPELLPGAPRWASDAGGERFDVDDPELARALLAASSYDGTPIRLMTTTQHQPEHNAALVIAQQLEAVGFVVDVQVLDGATLAGRRNEESAWELYVASASFRPDPVLRNLGSESAGWWDSPARDAALDALLASDDERVRQQRWHEVQRAFHEEVPRIKLGNIARLSVRSERLHGVGPTALQPDFSNAWLEP